MTLLHLFNCAALTFGPHVVYYRATPLSEYGTWGVCVQSGIAYMLTALLKLILWASLLKASDHESFSGNVSFDVTQELLKSCIGLVDVAGLYYVLTQLPYRNISFSHKFQAVGLGWALAEALAQKLAPLWFSARGLEFTWAHILDGVRSNTLLVLRLSLAALCSLLWLRKHKPPMATPFLCATVVAITCLPSVTEFLRVGLTWNPPAIVLFELVNAIALACATWALHNITQKQTKTQ